VPCGTVREGRPSRDGNLIPAKEPVVIVLPLLVVGVALITYRRCDRARDLPVALLVGVATTLPLFAVLHDISPAHLATQMSWVSLIGLWVVTSAVLGAKVAATVRSRLGSRRIAAVLTGMGTATVLASWGPARLLRADRSPVEQLAWTLGEEDSAQIVGIAREVITVGPAGGELASIYGTGFMVVPVTLMRMLGIPMGETDPRILAVYAFTFSVVLAIATIGLAMTLLSLTVGRASERPTAAAVIAVTVASALGGIAALSIAVFLPMQTGFLTLVWSMSWLVLTGSFVAIRIDRSSIATDSLVLAHVVASAYLVVRSWPFLLAAVIPPLLIALRPLPWRRGIALVRSRWYIPVTALVVVIIGAWQSLSSSLFGEVLSYGREALTIGASGIAADRAAIALVTLAIVITLLAVLMTGGERWQRALIVAGMPGGLLLSWFGLKFLALLLTDGELNYAGWKLFYATVSVGAIVGLAALAGSTVLDRRWSSGLAGTAVGLLLVTSSSTVQTYERWWDRTAPQSPPHAVAAIDAVRASSVDLPIRCMPQPGAAATEGARWAAYYCVRWMEDAFNAERFHGHRFTFLNAEGPTFEDAVERARRDDPSRYTFAYPMTVGPGWFGWDGLS
jgi:hypothetical protein